MKVEEKIVICNKITRSVVVLQSGFLVPSGAASGSFFGGSDGKIVCLQCWRLGFDPWVRKIPWRRKQQPIPVLVPGKFHGWRNLAGCSPWGLKESDTTERLHFHFSLSCIGEGVATHSSVLAWRIPGTGEPGGLQSMGSHRVGHD